MRKKPAKKRHAGFALIATLMMLVLLLLLAVGIQSVAAISSRSASRANALMEARANAKLALMIAIGELQKQVGPDQRITANGSILPESPVRNSHWMGVWDSWIAGDPANAPVGDEYPSATSHHRTIGNQPDGSMRPDYANKGKHFRKWMLSLNQDESADPLAALSVNFSAEAMPSGDAEAVLLVGAGTLGRATDQENYVGARLIEMKASAPEGFTKGRYAWWVGDESQKGNVMPDRYETQAENLTDSDKIFRLQAPGATDFSAIEELSEIKDHSKLVSIPTPKTLDLIANLKTRPSERFHDITTMTRHVLADVREGGLKRDLSSLLERNINPDDVYSFTTYTNTGVTGSPVVTYRKISGLKPAADDFMLYRFDALGRENVVLQDLAAYYQLYDHDPYPWARGRREGVAYASSISTSPRIASGMQMSAPDYGNRTAPDKYLRAYTTMYRQPIPIKIQFLLATRAEPIPQAVIDAYRVPYPDFNATHFLHVGIIPSITMWNPSNLPVVMKGGLTAYDPQVIRLSTIPLYMQWTKNGSFKPFSNQVNWLNGQGNWYSGSVGGKGHLFTSFLAGTRNVLFEPGEVKVFTFPYNANFRFTKDNNDNFLASQELSPGWDPGSFLQMPRTASHYPGSMAAGLARRDLTNRNVSPTGTTITAGTTNPGTVYNIPLGTGHREKIMFNASDTLRVELGTGSHFGVTDDETDGSEIAGSGLQFMCIQKSNQSRLSTGELWSHRNYQMLSRVLPAAPSAATVLAVTNYNSSLIQKGMPGGVSHLLGTLRNGSDIIQYDVNNGFWPFLQFSLMATCELGSASSQGYMAGRKYPNRPFTHASSFYHPFIDNSDNRSMYNYGWNWWVEEVNDMNEAQVHVDMNNRGYYGSGYTSEEGVTHVVQQEIPLVPPLSIAALSHAHLGGYSLGTDNPSSNGSFTDRFEAVTAVGSGGMFPQTHQAIGNSYAHPNLAADKAFSPWQRHMKQGDPKTVTFADHSYLANKALWDEYFFSSITPKRAAILPFESGNQTALQVAQAFFFEGKPLPNRRIQPYGNRLDQAGLGVLYAADSAQQMKDGLADKIAAHLMVEGALNVNSTSVKAWEMLLKSLRGKSVTYLNKSGSLNGVTKLGTKAVTGTPVGFGMVANSPNVGTTENVSRDDEWTGWRELSDTEILKLAEAIVKQVKLRGPFLSLSEFMNRRLDGSMPALATKGALQAALDDESVPINAKFRSSQHKIASSEIPGIAFPEALEGPAAYGSAAYVDQADLLRHMAEQLAPRGDTFVIRAYGDALDASGHVTARAWCEAVVQRLPEYVDADDESHVRQADLNREQNRMFGRKMQICGFRWMSMKEI